MTRNGSQIIIGIGARNLTVRENMRSAGLFCERYNPVQIPMVVPNKTPLATLRHVQPKSCRSGQEQMAGMIADGAGNCEVGTQRRRTATSPNATTNAGAIRGISFSKV